jgi:3-phenylpropionate/trans-cinnamate dioxygenase ferredoxin component
MDDTQRFNVGPLDDLADGDMTSCPVADFDVLVCRVQGQLYALEDLCSHADTTLSDGFLMGHTVTCSLHGAQFDVRTGDHKGPPAYCGVKRFDVESTPDGVVVVVRTGERPDPGGPDTGYFMTR